MALQGASLHGQVALKETGPNAPRRVDTGSAQRVTPLERRVSLDLQNVTLRQALHEIDKQARLGLAFTPLIVPLDRKVTIQAESVTVADALERVLRGTGVKAVVTTSETVMLVRVQDLRAQAPAADTGRHGQVLVHVTDDTTSRPLVGAVVRVQGTQLEAKTTETGYVGLLQVPNGFVVLSVRYLGYTPAEKRIFVPDTGYVAVNVPLKMGMAHLQEVVTTATGPRRRYELGNDITTLNVDSLVATQPISNVTQILEGRVPGLTVQHTSGAPGDPSRIRLRGASSMLESNDPIIIVDGIRIYYQQSDSTSANRAAGRITAGSAGGAPAQAYATPSPLDEIDPASIETIEVLKGPSAATLYGPDAANGVIAITTKRGKPGPARWTLTEERGISNTPGAFPLGYYRWGTDYGGNPVLCPLSRYSCTADSLVRFQALDHRQYSVIRPGTTGQTGVDVSGGSAAMTYYLGGSLRDERGIVGLPSVEIARYQSIHDASPLSWMEHPQHLSQWTATSGLAIHLSDRADASVNVGLDQTNQQRSDLERAIGSLMATYIDPKTKTYWRFDGAGISTVPDLLPDFYHRVTADATNFRTGGSLSWRPLNWLSAQSNVGINVITNETDDLLPIGMLPAADSAGSLSSDRQSLVETTLNLGGAATIPLPWGIKLTIASGTNLTKRTAADLGTGVTGLAPGTNSIVGAQQIVLGLQSSTDVTSYGWYLEPDIMIGNRFAINPGMRLDQSSTFGKNAHQPLFPKVNASWIVSNESFFPFKKIFDTFRLRGAYGEAGVWPGPIDQLRLYQSANPWIDGGFQPATQIYQVGNTHLRPERSTEIEAGFDADLFRDWISFQFSYFRKMRYDAIENVPVAPSVYGLASMNENIGDIRNVGVNGSLSTQLLRTDPLSWSARVDVGTLHGIVTRLGAGIVPFGTTDARVVAGYPLFSRWSRPILGYADANHDGIIAPDEVLVGDSLVYMGSSEPLYTVGMGTSVTLLRGAVSVSANFTYEAGVTQLNNTILNSGGGFNPGAGAGAGNPGLIFVRGASDPHAPLGEQAAIAALGKTDYGLYQTVNAFRFQSLSVGFQLPAKVIHSLVRATSMSVMFQGTNLALFTNYKGKDPDVNAFATGNQLADNGVLPAPRIWQITVRVGY